MDSRINTHSIRTENKLLPELAKSCKKSLFLNRFSSANQKDNAIMKAITSHVFEFETIEEEEDEPTQSQEDKTAYITLRMNENEVS